MYPNPFNRATILRLTTNLTLIAALLIATPARAAQIDIAGPAGSVVFGSAVAVLPNGNIVVTDPVFSTSSVNYLGAVYLYSPAGTLINSFTGSSDSDLVGNGGITVLPSGNFVIASSNWNNNTGAATWVNGATGLAGTVSATNSLIGAAANDYVGSSITVLSNGNYVISSPNWNGNAGAVTWASGITGLSGTVSTSNSLVGSAPNDYVGYAVTALGNGNYVVASPNWINGTLTNAGAVTWADGTRAMAAAVTTANSLYGTAANDYIGVVTALSNGNYVIASYGWHNYQGAVTWANGSHATAAPVSTANSLYGAVNDSIGAGGVTALTNGNYVVSSYNWNGNAGAVTWADGSQATAAQVSASNSLTGSAAGDFVGSTVTALSNGNYVVASFDWTNGSLANAGAVTWANGTSALIGTVSGFNSLIGTQANDYVGGTVTALSNGNYVVASPNWINGSLANAGAVTWANGSTGLTGSVSGSNSLLGTTANDYVGGGNGSTGSLGVTALSNGNYVIASPGWVNGSLANAGAATWANGRTGLVDVVSSTNSLIGTLANEYVGYTVTALSNGNYVIGSPAWINGTATNAGAATWANGAMELVGTISIANSLVGTNADDYVGGGNHETTGTGLPGITALANGNYAVLSAHWNGMAGAVSLGRGSGGTVGPLLATNSVLGTVPSTTDASLPFAYDASRDVLVVGQPAANIVSLFQSDLIFANGFE